MNIFQRSTIFTRILLLTTILGIFPIVVLAFLLVLPFDLSIDELRRVLGILLMAMPVAALCLAAIATRTIKSATQKLLMAQRRFYSGNLHIRLPTEGDRDSLNLYRGFNVMAELVQESLGRAVKEERTRALAVQAAHVAHDIRSPLSVFKNYLSYVGCKNDPGDVELRDAAMRSVEKLQFMADDLVNYSKANVIERSRQRISKIIADAVAETKSLVAERRVGLKQNIDGDLWINIDCYKFERVLVNLVNNAIQACGEGGVVVLSAEESGDDMLVVKVEDNGGGIEQDHLAHVFDAFFTKGKRGGTGLGLAYCKQVVEAHGGTIGVESELGKGTVVTIRMPNCIVTGREANAV